MSKRMGKRRAKTFHLSEDQTGCGTWFERDRSHVALTCDDGQTTIVEWWDEAVAEAIEDGFLDPTDFHGSAYEYAVEIGLIREP